MVAVILLLVVFSDLVCTIWCLGRFVSMKNEVRTLEGIVTGLGDLLRQAAVAGSGEVPVQLPEVAVDNSTMQQAMDVLGNASPEDLAEAAKVLEALGLGNK